MKLALWIAILVSLILSGCDSKTSLQRYFVDRSENKDFVVFDVSPGIINVDKTKLSAEQKEALASFDKMNILAFKTNKTNGAEYDAESKKLTELLKDEQYQQLMKVGSGKDGASVSFVGSEDNINEFVLFAKRKESGFVVVRILGDDMNPNNILNMISVLKSADIDSTQLEPLKALMQ
ncbi:MULTISPECIES: DUF4252 domain-containing protein [Flavobacterium]|uniref:DUF4252 domain-containing protein n=1 Tax=Flavobacterium sedimenticola TaxID=3043286 RepID=A0ABT6XNJ6_9FLAO|nr:DUF4252 domain-containing protein [Flavobacterium sedimenticola]MDI9256659.1 DUF4252 domain-containing protein [Flavobacterium sedimenticola]